MPDPCEDPALRLPALFLLLLAALVVPEGGASADAGSGAARCRLLKVVEWPVRAVRNHIVVDGAINGQPVGLVLDTGAQRSVILRSAAVRLDLKRREARGLRMFGVGGETKVEVATIDDFRLGAASVKDLDLLVAGEYDFGPGADVMLGEDFLRQFDVEFDLAHDRVRLHRAENCGDVALAYWTKDVPGEVAIEPIEDARPRIHVAVAINDQPIGAFVDSGAAVSLLTQDDAAALGVTPETKGVVESGKARGVGAKLVPMWSGPFRSFAIGNESIPDVRLLFADFYRDASVTATGSRITRKVSQLEPMILGADFLRSHRTLIAHSQLRMYFTYSGGPVFRADAPPPAAVVPGRESGPPEPGR